MITSKQIRTFSKIICNEKNAQWTQIVFHYKGRFRIVRMHVITPRYLYLYLVVDYKHMKVIDVDYNVGVGYWALRNNMQEYKVYVIVIQMFNSDFVNNLQQAPENNLWPIKSTYRTHSVCQVGYLLGMNKTYQYSLVETSNKKWPKNESDPQDNKYELPILIYDANQDALVQQKEGKPK
jgi:hypothetical protein